jgi:hypothetical protein
MKRSSYRGIFLFSAESAERMKVRTLCGESIC